MKQMGRTQLTVAPHELTLMSPAQTNLAIFKVREIIKPLFRFLLPEADSSLPTTGQGNEEPEVKR